MPSYSLILKEALRSNHSFWVWFCMDWGGVPTDRAKFPMLSFVWRLICLLSIKVLATSGSRLQKNPNAVLEVFPAGIEVYIDVLILVKLYFFKKVHPTIWNSRRRIWNLGVMSIFFFFWFWVLVFFNFFKNVFFSDLKKSDFFQIWKNVGFFQIWKKLTFFQIWKKKDFFKSQKKCFFSDLKKKKHFFLDLKRNSICAMVTPSSVTKAGPFGRSACQVGQADSPEGLLWPVLEREWLLVGGPRNHSSLRGFAPPVEVKLTLHAIQGLYRFQHKFFINLTYPSCDGAGMIDSGETAWYWDQEPQLPPGFAPPVEVKLTLHAIQGTTGFNTSS